MKGTRLEVVTIVENKFGRKSFVVIDCMSNTLHWNPVQGIMTPNALGYSCYANNIIDTCLATTRGVFRFKGRAKSKKKPRHAFVVEANQRCFYRTTELPIALTFDNKQVLKSVVTLEGLDDFVLPYKFFCGEQTHAFIHDAEMNYDATLIRG